MYTCRKVIVSCSTIAKVLNAKGYVLMAPVVISLPRDRGRSPFAYNLNQPNCWKRVFGPCKLATRSSSRIPFLQSKPNFLNGLPSSRPEPMKTDSARVVLLGINQWIRRTPCTLRTHDVTLRWKTGPAWSSWSLPFGITGKYPAIWDWLAVILLEIHGKPRKLVYSVHQPTVPVQDTNKSPHTIPSWNMRARVHLTHLAWLPYPKPPDTPCAPDLRHNNIPGHRYSRNIKSILNITGTRSAARRQTEPLTGCHFSQSCGYSESVDTDSDLGV